jgi:hypothetical protein
MFRRGKAKRNKDEDEVDAELREKKKWSRRPASA